MYHRYASNSHGPYLLDDNSGDLNTVGGSYWNGLMGDLVLVDGTTTQTQRDDLEQALLDWYGISGGENRQQAQAVLLAQQDIYRKKK